MWRQDLPAEVLVSESGFSYWLFSSDFFCFGFVELKMNGGEGEALWNLSLWHSVKIAPDESLEQLLWETTSRTTRCIFTQQPIKFYSDLTYEYVLHNLPV